MGAPPSRRVSSASLALPCPSLSLSRCRRAALLRPRGRAGGHARPRALAAPLVARGARPAALHPRRPGACSLQCLRRLLLLAACCSLLERCWSTCVLAASHPQRVTNARGCVSPNWTQFRRCPSPTWCSPLTRPSPPTQQSSRPSPGRPSSWTSGTLGSAPRSPRRTPRCATCRRAAACCSPARAACGARTRSSRASPSCTLSTRRWRTSPGAWRTWASLSR